MLVATKLVAYFFTGSISLLSSLIDSGVDVLASLMTAFGIAKALQPPDRDHRYGHGKAESLAALAQAAFIVGSAVFLSVEALDRFMKPVPILHAPIGYGVMVFAIVATIALLALQTYTVRQTGSLAIEADRMHYIGDILINLAVMASFAAQQFWSQAWVDPFLALCIALLLVRGASGIAKKALAVLMDAELPQKEREEILSLTTSVPGVMGAHDLRTRFDSDHRIIEIHVEMDAALTLLKAHEIVEAVEKNIKSIFPKADILIHQDPTGVEEKRLDSMIEETDPSHKNA